MIFLRCISFLVGALIVMGAPFLLLPDHPQQSGEVGAVLTMCIVIALLASGFFCVAITGMRMRRTRWLAGFLLGFPILGSISALLFEEQRDEIWMVFPLLSCAILMFVSFVYPANGLRPPIRLRPRDQVEIVKS